MSKRSECDKMLAVRDKSQAIGEFVEWMQASKGAAFCVIGEYDHYTPLYTSIDKLLAEFFDIDLDKVDKEKRAILEELSRRHDEEHDED